MAEIPGPGDLSDEGPQHVILEIDATQFLDVVHKYAVDGPQSTIDIPMGSTILCAKAMPDATIKIWARRPIDENAPLCSIGVWVFATGQPMPNEKTADLTYLDTVTIIRRAAIVTPNASPEVLIFHVFLLTDTLNAGNVKLG